MFIDESGTPCPSERAFVAAAIWCLPNSKGGCQEVLRYSVDRMRFLIKERIGKLPHELKFSAGLARYADDLLSLLLDDAVLKDRSVICNEGFPLGCPIRFSSSSIICSYEVIALTGTKANRVVPDYGRTLRARVMPELLLPAIMYDGRRDIQLDIVFDESIWHTIEEPYGSNLSQLISNNRISRSLDYRKSSSIPGLQLADLIAGMIRNHLLSGGNPGSFSAIQDARIIHFSKK